MSKTPVNYPKDKLNGLYSFKTLTSSGRSPSGMKMAPADTLSRQDYLDTSLDNADVAICPELVVVKHTRPSSHLSHPVILPIWSLGPKGHQESAKRISFIPLLFSKQLEVWRWTSLLQRTHVCPTRVLPCLCGLIALPHHPWSCKTIPYQDLSRTWLLVARTVHICEQLHCRICNLSTE